MLILNADQVRQALPMREAIEAMKRAYANLSSGNAEAPLRGRLQIQPHGGLSLFMPAFVTDPEGEALAVKVVSLFPGNPGLGLAYIQAAVLVLEPNTGRILGLLEGSSLTAIRTGAASGAATDLLARHDSRILAVFGAGAQGRTQVISTCTVRDIQTVWIYDSNLDAARALAVELAGKDPVPSDIRVANSSEQATATADVICTATTSAAPVFEDKQIRPGTHISAIGSYMPEMQEVPGETVRRARLFVDSRSAALAETGDLIRPIKQGLFGTEHIAGELGELVLGGMQGRQSTQQITLFKSVGIAVQDAAAASLALGNAARLGIGQEVPF